jgi:hypothetical protein
MVPAVIQEEKNRWLKTLDLNGKDSKRREIMAKKPTAKKLTDTQKYRQLKAQTEAAGMKVEEVDGKIVVRRKK